MVCHYSEPVSLNNRTLYLTSVVVSYQWAMSVYIMALSALLLQIMCIYITMTSWALYWAKVSSDTEMIQTVILIYVRVMKRKIWSLQHFHILTVAGVLSAPDQPVYNLLQLLSASGASCQEDLPAWLFMFLYSCQDETGQWKVCITHWFMIWYFEDAFKLSLTKLNIAVKWFLQLPRWLICECIVVLCAL